MAHPNDLETGKVRLPGYTPSRRVGFPWGRALLGVGLVYGGLAANNRRIWSDVPPLQNKLSGEVHYYRSRQGVIFYKEAGQAEEGHAPVVFLHGIGAGNYSCEWEANFKAIAAHHKAYAFDLLGFGNSERPNLKYTAEVYIKQLTEFLDNVVGQPAIVIASSLSSSYAVQVAFRRPTLIQKLVLMEPTGIFLSAGESGPNLVGSLSGAVFAFLRLPVIGKAIYSAVTSRPSIKGFMGSQMFYDKSLVTPDRIEQHWLSAHQAGAEYAPPSFLTGLLNAEIGETLSKIEQPVMILWGSDSRITPLTKRQELSKKNPKARVETLPRTLLSINQEQPEEFNRLVLEFLGQPVEDQLQAQADTVGFIQNRPEVAPSISTQLPPFQKEELDYSGVEWTPQRSERGGSRFQLPPFQKEELDYSGVEWTPQRSEKGGSELV